MEETHEVWKVIKDFPKYEVSTYGNVRHIKKQRMLKPGFSGDYKFVNLTLDAKKKNLKVHRLVAITFISNPKNKKTVNHKDHNPLNNNVTNLEWFTQKEQNNHKRNNNNHNNSVRKVWRIDKNTDEKLELYQTIAQASKWIFDNKLTKVIEFNYGSSIKSRISAVAQGHKLVAFGYKWMYEQEENLSNEIWKPLSSKFVNGTEGYFISSLGRVRNKKGRISSGYTTNNGYLRISIGRIPYQLHRLVAQAFLPNPKNCKVVNHKDGNKKNAKLDNLEWCTHHENITHAIETGLTKNKKSIIQYDLNMIKLNEFSSIKEAESKLNISVKLISDCCNGRAKIAKGFIFKYKDDNNMNFNPKKLNTKAVIQFDLNMNQLAEFESIKTASSKLNINCSSISACCKRNRQTAGGFIFKFKDETKTNSGNTLSIIQYDLNMNKLAEFSSLTEASKQLNIRLNSISNCCNGKAKFTKGFIFKFKD